VVVIDELGKMELASEALVNAVSQLFDGDADVVATVHARKHAFTDELKGRDDTELIRLTRENRDGLPEEIAERLT
jgi:nucleoside-triphosphatase